MLEFSIKCDKETKEVLTSLVSYEVEQAEMHIDEYETRLKNLDFSSEAEKKCLQSCLKLNKKRYKVLRHVFEELV